MAPFHIQHFHRAIPSSRPEVPTVVRKFISIKILMLLFLGTAGIFCFAIVFWKTGSVFRHFTRGRVLREGKLATTRYARTWYGWVPVETHEANKDVLKRFFKKVRKKVTWRSSHTDYRWVWWDPTLEETEKYINDQRALCWLPRWLRSDGFETANSIWNPGPSTIHHTHRGFDDHDSPDLLPPRAGRTEGIQTDLDNSSGRDIEILKMPIRAPRHLPWLRETDIAIQTPISACGPKFSIYLTFPLASKRSGRQCVISTFANGGLTQRSAAYLQTISSGTIKGRGYNFFPSDKGNLAFANRSTRTVSRQRYSRKCKSWAARLQMDTFDKTVSQCGLLGRPGSPMSELLNSSSDQSPYPGYLFKRKSLSRLIDEYTTTVPEMSPHTVNTKSTPQRLYSNLYRPDFIELPSQEPRCIFQFDGPRSPGSEQRKVTFHTPKMSAYVHSGQTRKAEEPLQKISNSEVRLLDDLDRRLEWLEGECDPGRRPYQFALLPNHWLNPDTWFVYDPVSRVSADYRRQYGDPRYKGCSPDSLFPRQKPKYTNCDKMRARVPHIDSWRLAVNKERKSSGLQDFLKAIELLDGSADDTPDGAIDTASWILRKPPQGFGMSTKQMNAFYEGGAGWQESLDEWKRVDWAYRIRKAVHEGRANRTRMGEVARGIGKIYRTATRREIPISAAIQKKRAQDIVKRPERRTRNGSTWNGEEEFQTYPDNILMCDNRLTTAVSTKHKCALGAIQVPKTPSFWGSDEVKAENRRRYQSIG